VDEELELTRRWIAGDPSVGAELFERHYDAIECFFRNKVDVGLEDLIQRTFLIALETRERFRGASSFRTYLFGVAYNVLRNHYRASKRERERLDFGHSSVADLAPGASSILRAVEQRSALLHALRSIPIDFQVVLELHYWEGLDGKAIAEVLDIPHGTARSRLRLGRDKLVRALEAQAGSPAEFADTLGNLDDWARALRAKLTQTPLP
jgi:RNA polymerase sigma-70 factor (ECF subfamily)